MTSSASSHHHRMCADAAPTDSLSALDALDAAVEACANTPLVPDAAATPDASTGVLGAFARALADVLTAALDEHQKKVLEAIEQQRSARERSRALLAALGDEQLVTREELATMMRIHPQTLHYMIRDGRVPAGGKLGAQYFYSLGTARAIVRAVAAGRPAVGAESTPAPRPAGAAKGKRGRPARTRDDEA